MTKSVAAYHARNSPDIMGRGFLGKFRGKVVDNLDLEQKGRVKVSVKDVLDGEELGWAMPAMPYGGNGVGFFMIPPKGTDVWVEFEGGDPDFPIWTGCFWPKDSTSTSQLPPGAGLPSVKVIQTEFVTITIEDVAGGKLTIQTKAGMKLVMNSEGAEISTKAGASVNLKGNEVSINQTALQVK
ncbi:phage baseplate assembly protein V [Schlesneria paludicola]|uniref:phage baseplate assembly protein V n=1 Tax=Schlesneria paludicola TaxID=360056 RepID=UPI00029AA0B8|nr:phage baseplate assembly protein V [Schlesneria paludicola]